jgi:hypothetical protein
MLIGQAALQSQCPVGTVARIEYRGGGTYDPRFPEMSVSPAVPFTVCDPDPGYLREQAVLEQPSRPLPWKWIALGAIGVAGAALVLRRGRECNPYLTSGLPDDWDTMAEPSEHERPLRTGTQSRRGAGYSHHGAIQTEIDPNDIRYKHVWVGGHYVGQIFDTGARFWSLSPVGDREHDALQSLAYEGWS